MGPAWSSTFAWGNTQNGTLAVIDTGLVYGIELSVAEETGKHFLSSLVETEKSVFGFLMCKMTYLDFTNTKAFPALRFYEFLVPWGEKNT